MNQLTSIIIPCFNAERWLGQAIDSCLVQSYQPIEIIVIDDGSIDGSLDVIKSYGDRIIHETGPNKGGNHARNRGFALSKGDYIQFLDADDYLLPQKIEKQVQFLESSKVDVVYGNWRHQYHHENGGVELDDIKVSGYQADILESLLSGWWVSPACLLFRRSVVQATGGWDESLRAGQDRDFFLSIAIGGAKIGYQPECDSIYRRYGAVTVSSSSKTRYLESHISILEKYESLLARECSLSNIYKEALAQSYFAIARLYLDIDHKYYKKFLEKTLKLAPRFRAQASERTALYILAQRLIGFKALELMTLRIKQIRKTFQTLSVSRMSL